MFSPDGKWIAYESSESGNEEVYVRARVGSGAKWQVSIEGGNEPMWRGDGRELFYRNGNRLMSVKVGADALFTASKPEVLFSGEFEAGATVPSWTNYDVSPDGNRFLMVRPAPENSGETNTLHVVTGWSRVSKEGQFRVYP